MQEKLLGIVYGVAMGLKKCEVHLYKSTGTRIRRVSLLLKVLERYSRRIACTSN